MIQNQSFSRAAEILKMPKSSVSRAISRLERESGTKLIVRTTRSLTLTAAGRVFYEASIGPVIQLEDAQKSLYGKDSILTGLVRITAPEDWGALVVAPAIADLSSQHKDLTFELSYTEEIVDLVKDGFDIAIRIGRIPDSDLKLKRVGEIDMIAVASPRYLKTASRIKQPQDLRGQVCISFGQQTMARKWTLRSPKGTMHVPIKTKISSNHMTSLLYLVEAGGGVALLPSFLCKAQLSIGKLIDVLPGWRSPSFPVSIVTPLQPSSSARLKITVDKLYSALAAAIK